ncbi:MAG: hypothetical protein FJX53_11560 [Alphaproteobacteria bacterium]|nr:hypothetical protein [Alphaproteobacteria bacterium]
MALLTECGGTSTGATTARGTGLFDAAMCAAARPVLRDARLYVFEHMSGVDTQFFIESKMVRLAAMCVGLREEVEKARAAAAEADAENVVERLYFQITATTPRSWAGGSRSFARAPPPRGPVARLATSPICGRCCCASSSVCASPRPLPRSARRGAGDPSRLHIREAIVAILNK